MTYTAIFLILIFGTLLFLYILNILDPGLKGRHTRIEQSILRHIHNMNSLGNDSMAIQYLVPYEKNLWWNILRKKLKIHLYQYTYIYDTNTEKRFSNMTLIISRNKVFHLLLPGHINTKNRKMAQQALDKLNCTWKLP